MTPGAIITDVRDIIQDTDATNYRYDDSVLLRFVNQTIKRMVLLRPDLFIHFDENIPTTPLQVEQQLFSDKNSFRLADIFRIKNGSAVEEVDRLMFNRMDPDWVLDTAGQPRKFMRHPKNPNRFFLYPRPVVGVVLVGEYVKNPPTYIQTNALIDILPSSYFGTIVDGTVFIAESVDDEFVNNQRAKLFYDSFVAGLSVSVQSRSLVDLENATLSTTE